MLGNMLKQLRTYKKLFWNLSPLQHGNHSSNVLHFPEREETIGEHACYGQKGRLLYFWTGGVQ